MLPESADKYGTYEDKGIEVVISSSRSGAPEVSGRQEVDIDVVCRIISPKRYTENPTVEKAVCEWMLDGCANLLIGYRPKQATKPMFFVGHNLQIPENGRWTLIATFRFTKVVVPAGDTTVPTVESVIQNIIVTDQLGELVNVNKNS
jgi:hypothetical protein